jgi:hypothetical protein
MSSIFSTGAGSNGSEAALVAVAVGPVVVEVVLDVGPVGSSESVSPLQATAHRAAVAVAAAMRYRATAASLPSG